MARLLTLILSVAVMPLGQSGCTSRIHPFQPVDLNVLRSSRTLVAALESKHSGRSGVLLHAEDHLEHDSQLLAGSWSFFHTRTRRYLVLDPADEELSTFKLDLRKQRRLTRAELVVLSPGESPRRFTLDDLVKEATPGAGTSYKLALPHITKGTLVEIRTEVERPDAFKQAILSHYVPMRFRLPCLRVKVSFVCHKNWKIQVKQFDPSVNVRRLEREVEGYRKVYSFELKDQPPAAAESFAPYPRADIPHVTIQVKEMLVGQLRYVGAEDWAEVARDFARYVIDNDAVFSNRVTRLTQRIVGKIDDPRRRFEAILRYIQRTIRLDEDHQDRDFADMLSTKRGTSRQISALTHKMLRGAGIEAHLVLIHSAADGPFDEAFISRHELDQDAVTARIGGRTYLALPYVRDLPIGLIPAHLQGQPALQVGPEGMAGWITTPVLGAESEQVVERYTVRVAESRLDVKEERTYHGLGAYKLRRQLSDLRGAELRRKLRKLLTYTEGQIKISSAEVRNLRARGEPLRIEYTYMIDNLVTRATDEVLMQTAGLFSPTSRSSAATSSGQRLRSITIASDGTYKRVVQIKFPAAWHLQTTLEDLNFSNRFGTISSRHEQTAAGALRIEQRLTLKRQIRPRSEISALMQVLGKGKRLHVPTLVWRTSTEAPASAPTTRPHSSPSKSRVER